MPPEVVAQGRATMRPESVPRGRLTAVGLEEGPPAPLSHRGCGGVLLLPSPLLVPPTRRPGVWPTPPRQPVLSWQELGPAGLEIIDGPRDFHLARTNCRCDERLGGS
jgi:hypothetical protein